MHHVVSGPDIDAACCLLFLPHHQNVVELRQLVRSVRRQTEREKTPPRKLKTTMESATPLTLRRVSRFQVRPAPPPPPPRFSPLSALPTDAHNPQARHLSPPGLPATAAVAAIDRSRRRNKCERKPDSLLSLGHQLSLSYPSCLSW
jgi:hypothetical protein